MLGGLAAGAAEEKTPPPPPSEDALDFAEAAVPVDGSEADEDLQLQVAVRLFDMDQASRPMCRPRLLSARELEPERKGALVERWFVKSCGQIFPYRVVFAPNPASGDTTFTAKLDTGPYGMPAY